MSATVLKSKLHIPSLRPELVSRPRLVERLKAGLDCRFVLVSAPAGFGKTTLLSECAARCGHPVAWVSLDKADNEPVRFWTYVVAALRTIPNITGSEMGQAVLAMFRSSKPLPMETPLSGLINELFEIAEPFVLILDDLHEISNPQINDALALLLENQPPKMHLVISSRADPPWPLARWRASGQVIELRTDDLRFTSAEAAAFLNDVMELDLSAADIAALEARTEGWIAGLQLAALSMQGRQDVRAFIKAFSGSHRFILDYLVEEVLDRQPADIQEFLLQTSILERLTASLCNAVRFGPAEMPSSSRGEHSQAILEQLEQANLFLVPLDDERRWYRYHHLFADLLRSRLEQEWRDHVSTLHLRASAWYERQGLISEAVGHALTAGDVERVARLAKQNALAMMDYGELTALAGLIEALPDEAVRSRPWLCITNAWVLVFAGLLDAVELRLRSAETAVGSSSDAGYAERRHIAGHSAAIRGYVAALRGDMSCAVELSRRALELLPDEDVAVRGLAADLLGSVLRWSGDLTAADEVLGQALAITQETGDSLMAVEALCGLAAVQLAQGKLHKTAATCREALRVADEHVERGGRRLPIAASGHNILSQVLREWNDLDGALRHAREGVALSEQWGWQEGMALGYRRLARALQLIGDADGAKEAMQKAKQAASGLSPWFGTHMAAHQARLWLAQGNLTPATHWAQESGFSTEDELEYLYVDGHSTLARVLIAQGRSGEASRLISRLVELTESAGAMIYLIETLVLQALALLAQGKDDKALPALERALTLAEPEGYVRTFVDEGALMDRLLRQAVIQGIAVDYAGRLLAALEKDATKAPTPLAVSEDALPPLVERLSPRETEVLRLLTTYLSHTEMAEELVVSVNTVRSHVKSIYGKLDVHSRLEAVERARDLGLLD